MALREPKVNAGFQYVSDVNKGNINMSVLMLKLNQRWGEGYRLHTAFPQGGNTIMIFEKRDEQ